MQSRCSCVNYVGRSSLLNTHPARFANRNIFCVLLLNLVSKYFTVPALGIFPFLGYPVESLAANGTYCRCRWFHWGYWGARSRCCAMTYQPLSRNYAEKFTTTRDMTTTILLDNYHHIQSPSAWGYFDVRIFMNTYDHNDLMIFARLWRPICPWYRLMLFTLFLFLDDRLKRDNIHRWWEGDEGFPVKVKTFIVRLLCSPWLIWCLICFWYVAVIIAVAVDTTPYCLDDLICLAAISWCLSADTSSIPMFDILRDCDCASRRSLLDPFLLTPFENLSRQK